MNQPTPHLRLGDIRLRDVIAADLPIFFEQQCDPEATMMAGFPMREHDAFMAHWAKNMANTTNTMQTIVAGGQVAGNIVSWEQHGEREVGYWLGRRFWGQGIASAALVAFVEQLAVRPLYAYVVKHNIASRRVLEKSGFALCGEDDEGFLFKL